MGKIEKRLEELGIILPPVPIPLGTYKPVNQVGSLLYTSGQGSLSVIGRVGEDLTQEEGYEAAREAALRCLACIQEELGTLDRVEKVWKVLGFVNSAPDFTQQPKVMNGASDLLVEIFGEAGRHARSAIGASQLPDGIAVEVEMIVQIRD
ncbi:MAG: RidA family protein [Bacillota bacterium]|jgi:enamine deaminase RidA (YjgF/YER057c/UK114 family)